MLAVHFKSDVQFIEATSRSAPDISINGIQWELKSPVGVGGNNIQKNMREASAQSKNIVIDLRRSKLHQTRALATSSNLQVGSKS
jgi:Contact-dependent growth inhibition CdiA C-terminal domain